MLPTQLPHYQGQYRVGYVDIEASGKDEQKHGLLCRIYYPTNESKSHQQSWLPQPWKYSKGYGDFLKLPRVATAMLLYPSMFNIRLPAIRHAEILAKSQVETFPVAIFSHGLGGMRTTYSNFCGNLASRGFIVVAPEHSDGTACYTNRKAKHDIPYYHITIADKLEHETQDEGLFRIRSQQLEHRKDEIFNAIDIIKKINDGNLDHINNIDVEPKERDDHDLMVKSFKNRIDMNKMIMTGHSFGVLSE
jgi:platelet-activating factor acetylhydrolase